ncbi:hypothetical protein ACA910_021661 [Epithemia clementina (nom. ined.)]
MEIEGVAEAGTPSKQRAGDALGDGGEEISFGGRPPVALQLHTQVHYQAIKAAEKRMVELETKLDKSNSRLFQGRAALADAEKQAKGYYLDFALEREKSIQLTEQYNKMKAAADKAVDQAGRAALAAKKAASEVILAIQAAKNNSKQESIKACQ